MSMPIRTAGVCLVLSTFALIVGVNAQSTDSPAREAPKRRPFAKAGTPKRTERIRFYDIKHIKAELTIDTRKRTIRGVVTHSLAPLHPYLTKVELDCGPKLKVSRVSTGGGSRRCDFATKEGKLHVTLDKAYEPGDTVDLAIEYAGSPDRGLYFVMPEAPYPEKRLSFWTQGESEETHDWIPCYDFPNERATSEMIVTTEKPLFVLSNGRLVETKDNADSTTTYHWKMDVPHVSYLISLAASDFAVYRDKAGDLPVDYYVAHQVNEATARRFMGKTPEMIRFFGDKTGQPYPYAKYAQVCVPDFLAGGMENITATTMTEIALHDEIAALEHDEDGLVSHELAHQWFGDLLTCKDWSHIWLNEGFASYFGPLFTEHDRGDDAFRLEMNGALDAYLGSDRDYRRPIVEARYEDSNDMFDSVTYSKGACILHSLRGVLGDDAWWNGIRTYVSTHKVQVVDSDDFRKAMEKASGKDLTWFFDQWVYKAGHPELKVRWHFEDADKSIRVRVQQTQTVDAATPLFRLPTTLEISYGSAKPRVIPIVIDGASHEFVIPAPERPKLVQIDPKGWLIKELNFEKSDDESLFQLEHASCILGRIEAGRALEKSAKSKPEVATALAAAWKREKSPRARHEMCELICDGEETFRAALIEAAQDSDARVRVAAITGLGKLSRDDKTERILRAAWANAKEAYGARGHALRGLIGWKVKDSEKLLTAALEISANHHSIPATALDLMLETATPKSRDLAALYSKYGQPGALRSTAIGAFSRLAKDDPTLQDLLIELADDLDRSVRFQAWNALRELRVKKALPRLEARLSLESADFGGNSRQVLKEAIDALKDDKATDAKEQPSAKPEPDRSTTDALAELEHQAAELEKNSKELRSQIAAMKHAQKQGGEATKSISGTSTPTTSP
jgi:aminopeptidase N